MFAKIVPYLKLMRISALPTCWSNVLAAFWLGGGTNQYGLLAFLLLASSFFYLGGMVLNDYYDAELDAEERPERPIPKGEISKQFAEKLAKFLLGSGLVAICLCERNPPEGAIPFVAPMISFFLVLCIYYYNSLYKRIPVLGPIFMGLCRLFNIHMVLFAVGSEPNLYSGFVFLYIAGITILAGYEVQSVSVRKWIGIGLSSIILIDVVWCLAFVGWVPALIILALYPVVMGLKRVVSMT